MSLSRPASDRVLFNEDYLHMILPYLLTTDLKSARLVTPFWNKIATKILGRKSFEPIRFSDLTFEDWMTLRREIEASRPEEDPRIKLFQGFHLTWVDVAIGSYCTFMAPFKPSQIIIKGGDANPLPGTALISLLTPIMGTLLDLTLEVKWDFLISDMSLKNNVVTLQGMRLKRLHLRLWQEGNNLFYLDSVCNFLSTLLESQAPSLERLNLQLDCNATNVKNIDSMIQCPIFHRLTSLALRMNLNSYKYKNPRNNFAPFDFCERFPHLLSLNINHIFLQEISGEFNKDLGKDNVLKLTKGHPLKKLVIYSTSAPYDFDIPIELFDKLGVSFPMVEEFFVENLFIDEEEEWGRGIPWKDTLKDLEMSVFHATFNLVHLKKLETLDYTAADPDGYVPVHDVIEFTNMLLEHYRELSLLKGLCILGFEVKPNQMTQIKEAIPAEFWNILTIEESHNPNSSDEDATSESSDTETD